MEQLLDAAAPMLAQEDTGNPLSLLILILPIAVVVWLVVLNWLRRSTTPIPIPQNCVTLGEPERVLDDLQLILSGEKNTVVRRGTSDSLSIDRTTIPTWAVVLAVLTFPLGLLFLLARNTTTGTLIAVETANGHTSLRTAGSFSDTANHKLRIFLDARAAGDLEATTAGAAERWGARPPPPTHRPCPYCAEDIKLQAVVCRYCGRDVVPLGPPPFTGSLDGPAEADLASVQELPVADTAEEPEAQFVDANGRTWASDPTGRYRYRSFDKGEWTTLVRNSRTGLVSSDPEGLDWIG